MRRWFERGLAAVAIFGAVLVLGAVGECEQGGDLNTCTVRTLLGIMLVTVAMAIRAVREEREKE